MKILHTSDWHLGRSLYGRKRYNEFSEFLDWLADVIEKESIDALLVAGDIFDNSTPSNYAQELIDEAIEDSKMEVRRVKNKRIVEQVLSRSNTEETLDDLDINDVFMRCLESYEVIANERPRLIQSYKEIVKNMQEEDSNEDLKSAV